MTSELVGTAEGEGHLDAYATTGGSPPDSEQVVDIALSTLLGEDGAFRTVQVREQVNQEAVDAYAAAMQEAGGADEFPPIVVYEVTDRNGLRYLAGGLHRCSAARQAGLTSIRGELRQGTWHEALEAAVKTNATHGHRPSFGDVCATLLQMDQDPQMRALSGREKARLIGVSEGTVRNAVKHLEETAQVTQSSQRTTVTVTRKDGTTYQLPKTPKTTAQITQSAPAASTAGAGGGDDLTETGGDGEAPGEGTGTDVTARGLADVVRLAQELVDAARAAGLDPQAVSVAGIAGYRALADATQRKLAPQVAKSAAHILTMLANGALRKVA